MFKKTSVTIGSNNEDSSSGNITYTKVMDLVNSQVGGLDSIVAFQFLSEEDKLEIANKLKPAFKRMFEEAFL